MDDGSELMGASPTRVSVVVPTRDRPGLLREALASIRALDGPDLALEILVCDNGRSQLVRDIAQELGARYLPVERPGAAAARNAGIRAATGAYLAFLDDDDLWLPAHLRPQLALLAARPDLDAAIGQVLLTDDRRVPTTGPWPVDYPDDGDLFAAFLREYPQIGATVARMRVRETIGLLDEMLFGDEDWDWHLRLARRHRIGVVPVVGVLFRQRPPGTSDDSQWERLGDMSKVYFRHLMHSGRRGLSLPSALRTYRRHRWMYYDYFVQSAAAHLAAGDRDAAWRSVRRALVASPLHAARDVLRPGVPRDVMRSLLGTGKCDRSPSPG